MNNIDITRYSSILQEKPAECVSEKYKFIPTLRVLDVLRDCGWEVSGANQAKVRKASKQGFQKHAIKLVNTKLNDSLMVGSKVVPQILLQNSHSGTSSFIMQLATHVMVCSNGLVRSSGVSDEIRVRHVGYDDLHIESAAQKLALDVPKMMQEIDNFNLIALTEQERIAYAESAIEMSFDNENYKIDPKYLIRSYRQEEKEPTLWNTFNIVQEKIIKGGVYMHRQEGGTSRRSQRVKSIDRDIKLNKALWSLTARMAELKA